MDAGQGLAVLARLLILGQCADQRRIGAFFTGNFHHEAAGGYGGYGGGYGGYGGGYGGYGGYGGAGYGAGYGYGGGYPYAYDPSYPQRSYAPYAGASYGQPNPYAGVPGSNQPSASSHPPY